MLAPAYSSTGTTHVIQACQHILRDVIAPAEGAHILPKFDGLGHQLALKAFQTRDHQLGPAVT
jgi:hypothetical protein